MHGVGQNFPYCLESRNDTDYISQLAHKRVKLSASSYIVVPYTPHVKRADQSAIVGETVPCLA